MNKDLTVGKPESVLWRFCLPLFGSVIFQQLYNIADSLVAGKFINESALAAVGNSYEITLIFIAFAFGCNMGCSVIVSRLFGAKEYRNMKTAVSDHFYLYGCFTGCYGDRRSAHQPGTACSDPHSGRYHGCFPAVSEHLYLWSSIYVLLQHCNRNFLRSR